MNRKIFITSSCQQGKRKYMEDIVQFKQLKVDGIARCTCLAIFDGHGGREAAEFAKEHLLNEVLSQQGLWNGDSCAVINAIRTGFLTTHYKMWGKSGEF